MQSRNNILDYPMSTEKNVQEDLIETARIVDIDNISLLDDILITEDIVGRLDTIMIRKYNRLDVLPIVLDYNGFESIMDVHAGTILHLPLIGELNDKTEIMQTLDVMDVNGITKHERESYSAEEAAHDVNYVASQNLDADKTYANNKLHVTLNKVKYDKSTGKIIF